MTNVWYDRDYLDYCFSLFPRADELQDQEGSFFEGETFSLGDDHDQEEDDDECHHEQVGEEEEEVVKELDETKDSSSSSKTIIPTAQILPFSQQQQQQQPLVLKQKNSSSSTNRRNDSTHQTNNNLIKSFFIAGATLKSKLDQEKCIDSPSEHVHVRVGPDYRKFGKKSPSEESFYEFFAFDVFKKRKRKLYEQVILPTEFNTNPNVATVPLPKILIVNLQIPNKAPRMIGGGNDPTDTGTSLVFYFVLRNQYLDSNAPSTKLALKFFDNKLEGRFKAITFIDNVHELKIPYLVSGSINRFNGKPVLIHKTGQFFKNESIFEVDVDVFQFPVLVRSALVATKSLSSNAKIRISFVLQGETDEELPERCLGTCELQYLEIERILREQ